MATANSAAVMEGRSATVTSWPVMAGKSDSMRERWTGSSPARPATADSDAVGHDLGLRGIGRHQVDGLGGGERDGQRAYRSSSSARPERMKAAHASSSPARDRGANAPKGAFQ